ncbi:hypothetical protein [Maribacter polysiphoniae]|uniref:hypothetical protein n=1 Tax=Maribacter polysiphoniae TaxID=429344 RepID=UPI0030811F1C
MTFALQSCGQKEKEVVKEIEKAYGYSHALKIGNDIKISGAVSMDDKAKYHCSK